MGEPSELERMGDRGRRDTTIAPPMPVAAETEMGTWIFLLKYDKHPSIGWQHRLAAKGGPCFLVGKETVTGGLKVFERFPHTEEGWVQAWQFLVKLDNTLEGELRAKLAARSAADSARAAVKELDSRTQALVKSVVLLGGYLAEEDMPVGKPVDDLIQAQIGQRAVAGLRAVHPGGWPFCQQADESRSACCLRSVQQVPSAPGLSHRLLLSSPRGRSTGAISLRAVYGRAPSPPVHSTICLAGQGTADRRNDLDRRELSGLPAGAAPPGRASTSQTASRTGRPDRRHRPGWLLASDSAGISRLRCWLRGGGRLADFCRGDDR